MPDDVGSVDAKLRELKDLFDADLISRWEYSRRASELATSAPVEEAVPRARRSREIVEAELADLDIARADGAISRSAFDAARPELAAELEEIERTEREQERATVRAEAAALQAGSDVPPPSESSGKGAAGPFDYACPRCRTTGALVCPNCLRPGPFSRRDVGVECDCGITVTQVYCDCGAIVMPKFFVLQNTEELHFGSVEYDCPHCLENSHLVCTTCGSDERLALTVRGLRCECGAVFTSADCPCGGAVPRAHFRYMIGSGPPTSRAPAKSVSREVSEEAVPFSGDEWESELPNESSVSSSTDFYVPQGRRRPSLATIAAAAFFFLVGVPWCIGTLTEGGPDWSEAAAKEAVKRRLKAPSTAKFVRVADYGRGRYYMEVDAQNSFGTMLRGHYCVALRGSDPNAPNIVQVLECDRFVADVMFGD